MNTNKQQSKPEFTKKDIFVFILMALTAVLITAAGIIYKQNFLRILPLYVSLVIGLLQSRVNRFASLLGSANSILYGVVYIWYKLYGSGVSALLFSCPIQILTFIRWNKNKSGESTVLRKMTWRQRILLTVGFAVLLVALWFVLPLFGSQYVFLDSATTLLGILIYFLTMFAYIEYPVFMIANGIINIALYIEMVAESPETMTYLIFSVYSFVCTLFACFEAKKLYKKQKEAETV